MTELHHLIGIILVEGYRSGHLCFRLFRCYFVLLWVVDENLFWFCRQRTNIGGLLLRLLRTLKTQRPPNCYSGADMWIWRALSEESMKFGTWGFWGMLKPIIAGTMMPDEGFMPKMRNSRWPPQNLRFIITRLVYVRFVWFWGLIVCFRGQAIQWNT